MMEPPSRTSGPPCGETVRPADGRRCRATWRGVRADKYGKEHIVTEWNSTACVALARLLYRCTKWKRMEHPIMALAHRVPGLQCLPATMRDGRRLHLDLRNPTSMPYLLEGDFACEARETEFVRSVVAAGDTVIDVGANVGWYTSLLCEEVGEEGAVYAFEPNQRLAPLLEAMAAEQPQLSVLPKGLGDREHRATFHVPDNWISGSFGEVANTVEEQTVEIDTLDTFLEREGVSDVTFVKCDAEGAEADILRGAAETLNAERPPMWLVEMSSLEAAKFGHHPRELATFFEEADADYRSLMVNQEDGGLEPLRWPEEDPFWFNAVFVPDWLEDRVAAYDRTPDRVAPPLSSIPAEAGDQHNL